MTLPFNLCRLFPISSLQPRLAQAINGPVDLRLFLVNHRSRKKLGSKCITSAASAPTSFFRNSTNETMRPGKGTTSFRQRLLWDPHLSEAIPDRFCVGIVLERPACCRFY